MSVGINVLLNITLIADDAIIHLKMIIKRQTERLQTLYANYMDRICMILKEKGITVSELTSYLLNLSAFTDQNELPLFSDMKDELMQATVLEDVFISLTPRYASYRNFDVLEMVLTNFGSNENHEDLEYPKHYKQYTESHTINDFHQSGSYHDSTNDSTIELKLNIQASESLSILSKVKESVANILGLDKCTLRLGSIGKTNSLSLLIPTIIADIIFTSEIAFTEEQKDQFRAALVLSLNCNSHTFDFRRYVSGRYACTVHS